MARSVKVERLAKRKLEKAHVQQWDDLKDNAAMKDYYRDQARQELPGVDRLKSWTG